MEQLQGLGTSLPLLPTESPASATPKLSKSVSDTFSSLLTEVSKSEAAGDKAIENLQSGKANHLHEVMIATEEADISLRMLVQFRNKALNAYEEIMRMQI